jgi:hypothetical protein
MNGKANGLSLPLYQLVPLLMREANVVRTRIAAGDLERNVRRPALKIQQRVSKANVRYMEEEITASHFLKVCGSIYGDAFDNA